ncbi:hypothetical protein EVAR_24755_1 [Eumeta japonica]|uniref:Uncharacterized protein n=1 Tax=Eumeta variegata TaxID=151549 RepID=A0A4C1VER5_EUMVA|nr:hypothetical protein EVAR_24755_1 [Eumeta japonica]
MKFGKEVTRGPDRNMEKLMPTINVVNADSENILKGIASQRDNSNSFSHSRCTWAALASSVEGAASGTGSKKHIINFVHAWSNDGRRGRQHEHRRGEALASAARRRARAIIHKLEEARPTINLAPTTAAPHTNSGVDAVGGAAVARSLFTYLECLISLKRKCRAIARPPSRRTRPIGATEATGCTRHVRTWKTKAVFDYNERSLGGEYYTFHFQNISRAISDVRQST